MPAAPVGQPDRIAALDVLRGFALLGILVMNIQFFAMPGAAYMNPTAYGDLTGANWMVWFISHVFFDQKFMTIFSLLFGAGIVVFTTRAEAKGHRAGRLHYRRMFWLLLIGLVHAYAIWPGDILVLYAICGMLVFLLRRLDGVPLIGIGLLSIAAGSAIWAFFGWSVQYWPPEAVARIIAEDWRPPAENLAKEIAIYQGGWWTQMQERVPTSLAFQTIYLLMWGLWRAGGLMLIGMGFYKLGIVTGDRSPSFYARLFAIGVVGGLALILTGVSRNWAANWAFPYSFFTGSQFNYWGSLLLSGGWIGMVLLAVRTGALPAVASRLGAVGRMAFTNYLMHSIVCTTIFYGHGFGLYGQVSRVGQAIVVVSVWVFQLVVSPIWLRYFHFGPFEWLWRSLTYGQRQPFRRTEHASNVPPDLTVRPTSM
jgi:uncharacterized protein